MDISAWIDRHAGFGPDRPAIRFCGEEQTYSALAERVASVAGALRQVYDIGRGDRVAWLGVNHPDLLTVLFACARLGAMLVPMNWRLEEPECAALVEDCTPQALFVTGGFADKGKRLGAKAGIPVINIADKDWNARLCEVAPVPADQGAGSLADPVLISYTSGTTGAPKGVVLDQQAIFTNAVNSAHMHGLTGTDVALITLPFFHVGGLNILATPILHAGGLLVLHPVFDVEATFGALSHDGITVAVLVPTQIAALRQNPRWKETGLGGLRVLATGSSMVPRGLIRAVHDCGVPLIQVYGSTETAPLAAYLTADQARANEGSAGMAALHCELRIVDGHGNDLAPGETGEILVRGQNLAREYWQNPEATGRAFRDGWFYTGDLGHLDEKGFLWVDDRKKDMIISGGENVFPAEVEAVLLECDAIRECAVVGARDETWGETVVAFLVCEGAGTSKEEVAAHLSGRLARFKHPRRMYFVDALPRNAMGKVIKDTLRMWARNETTGLGETG